MSSRTSLALLGFLLVTVPLYGPALDVTGPDYVYEATALTVEDDRLDIVDEGLLFGGGIDGIDCYGVGRPNRACAFEATALDGNVSADHPDVTGVTGSPGALTDDPYVASTDGRVFARTTDWADGRYVLGLDRTNATAALDRVATGERYASEPVLTAVREGSVTTDDPIWEDNPREGRVVEADGDYYLVALDGEQRLLSADPLRERILEAMSVVLGLAILARVWTS